MSDVTKQFELLDVAGKDQHYIKITCEPFKGIIYKYGQVKIEPPENEQGNLKFSYEWSVENNPYENGEVDAKALETLVMRITMHIFQQVVDEDRIKENLA